MFSRSLSRGLMGLAVGSVAAVTFTSSASATILTFQMGQPDGASVLPAYGNRVGGAPQPPFFQYGDLANPTPNITVTYGTGLKFAPSAPGNPARQYGDLTEVIYHQPVAVGESAIINITLTADPGFRVLLWYFDLAAIVNFNEDLPVKSIRVTNALSGADLIAPIFNQGTPQNPLSIVPGTMPARHNRYIFPDAPVSAQSINIAIDVLNLGVAKVDRIGLDNIRFTQDPPIPASGSAAALAVGGLLAARRRRR